MRNVFEFLRPSGDPRLEQEFRAVYQEPNLRYAQIGLLLAIAGFGGFYVIDALAGRVSTVDGTGAARLALTFWFAGGAFMAYRYRELHRLSGGALARPPHLRLSCQ